MRAAAPLADDFLPVQLSPRVDEVAASLVEPARLASMSADGEDALRILDDEQEWSAFSRPSSSHPASWESSVMIEGMHCAACAIAVERALKEVPGVTSAEVSVGSHRARVVWSPAEVKPSKWMQAVSDSGYHALPANDTFAAQRRKAETRKALWRWLVAGLCMMQVMMYAWPAYVAQPGDLSREMEQLLRWASWVLTLPVILFSCGPFFRSALRDVLQARISMDLPVALGMGITFVVSTIGTFEPGGLFGREVYFDSLTMFVFFLLTGRWLELKLRDRTAGALESLMNRLPDSARRMGIDGREEVVAVRRLVPGDVIRVLPGEAFAADGIVSMGETQVDEALLTGESRPVQRGLGALVVAGSYNLSGTVLVNVQHVGADTKFAQIVALMESASSSKPNIAQLADRLAKPFLLAVLISAGAACAWWWQFDPERALMIAVAVLVVTCPCALSLATPAAMLASAGSLARQGVLVRRLRALESLAAIDALIFDKTGTLTDSAASLNATSVRPGVSVRQALSMAEALATHSLHPVSRAIQRAARATEDDAGPHETWRCDSVVETPGQGLQGVVRFDGDVAEATSTDLKLGSASFCSVVSTGDAGQQVYLSDSGGWLATFDFAEKARPHAQSAVRQLQTEGLTVYMLSGDNMATVGRVAEATGIVHAHGGCSPEEKLTFLKQLQQKGHKVAMVGDGLNDGPVLAGADVSFTLGQAVPLAQTKADFVILGDDPSTVVQTLRQARRTLALVRQNLLWALLYNAASIPLAVLGFLSAWMAGLGMAASSLIVVLNAMRLMNKGQTTGGAALQEA